METSILQPGIKVQSHLHRRDIGKAPPPCPLTSLPMEWSAISES